MGFLDLNKDAKKLVRKGTKPTLSDKAEVFSAKLMELKERFVVNTTVIEDFALSYAAGRTSKRTIVTLASFNGICQYVVFKVLGIYPVLVHPSTARAQAVGKIPRIALSGMTQKEYVYDWFTKNVRQLEDKKTSRDIADSWVLAKYGQLTQKH